MYKKEVIEISYKELLKLTGMERADFNHQSNSPTPTGIKAILNDFRKSGSGEVVLPNKVKELLLGILFDKDIIAVKKDWQVTFKPEHSWSAYDEDDCRHSVYSVDTVVSKTMKVI